MAAPYGVKTGAGRWSEETRARCFRDWIRYGRGWAAVSAASGVPVDTLEYWAKVDRWEERRRDEADAFMPGLGAETAANLRLAGHAASALILQRVQASVDGGPSLDPREMRALGLVIQHAGASLARVDPDSGALNRWNLPKLDGPSLDLARRLLGLPGLAGSSSVEVDSDAATLDGDGSLLG